MKRSELFFGAVLVPLDFGALMAAGAAAYFLRVSATVQTIRPAVFEVQLPFLAYMQLAAIVSAMVVGVFAFERLYSLQSTRRPLWELTRIFYGILIGAMLVIFYTFLQAELFNSRFIFFSASTFAFLFVALSRYVVRRIQLALVARGFGVHRVALVGNGRYATQLDQLFANSPELAYRVVGTCDIVRWDSLEKIYRRSGIDEIMQTDPSLPEEDNLVLLDFCDKYKIDYKYIPNLFESYASHVKYRQVGGVPMVELLRTPLDGWGRIAKRSLDIFGAIVGFIIFAPVFLVTMAAIKLDTPGRIFYRQIRVGRHKQPFLMYKFRSMQAQHCTGDQYGGSTAAAYETKLKQQYNERSGPLFKMRADPRITRVGRTIRRLRIDELPQFINVLKGDMSLLGPRPHLPNEVARYDKHQQKLFTLKPGMSGMAQVNGNAGLSFEQEVSLDITYIETWSLRLDIILLLKTFILLTKDRNAV